MITFLQKNNDTATIRVVSCEQSRICAAVNGGDIVNLDSMMNDVNADDDIKHINLSITYFPDEEKVVNFINKVNAFKSLNNQNKSQDKNTESSNSQAPKKSKKQKDNKDWTCPECGSNDCLVDKYGNKYPCLSCIQIDIGQRLMEKFGKEFTNNIDKNNKLMSFLVGGLKEIDERVSKGKKDYQNG